MRIDALLLDLGNVLVFHDNARLFRNLSERAHGDPAPLAEAFSGEFSVLVNEGALDGEQIRVEVCRLLGGADIPMPEFFELWSSHFTLHDAVMPRLEALAEKVKLVLVTNTNVLHWEWLKPRVPILRRFHACIASHEVRVAKPKPGIYQAALAAAGATAEHAAFFDDIPAYTEGAVALGIHGRVFTTAEAFDLQLRGLGLMA